MRLRDYRHLAITNLRGHFKQFLKVSLIVGILFSILFTGCLLLQGAENAALSHMTETFDGQILIQTSVDPKYCSDCDGPLETTRINALIAQYGGETISTSAYQTTTGTFAALPASRLASLIEAPLDQTPTDAIPILLTIREAADWLHRSTPNSNLNVSTQLHRLDAVRSAVIGQIIQDHGYNYSYSEAELPLLPDQTIFYGAGFLPSPAGNVGSLSLAYLHDEQNPLNLILSPASLSSDVSGIIVDSPNSHLDQLIPVTGTVLALFPTISSAANFLSDPANTCDLSAYFIDRCPTAYRYQSATVISNPVSTAANYRSTWLIFNVFTIIITIIALIVTISTYVRIIYQDQQTIALYQVMGATRGQTRLIYVFYLCLISLCAVLLALAVAFTIIYNIINSISQSSLQTIFTLGFGRTISDVFLCGWNPTILVLALLVLLASPLSILLAYKIFHQSHLTHSLKK